MLKHLSIKNFVIVDQLELDFSPGFTVLTGETGAGKSILIDALMLALGERGDASQIRQGCERAEISAVFDLNTVPGLADWLQENDLQGDVGTCLMRRVLDINGRSRGFINGHTVTLQQLRAAGEKLVAIHGQHAHQSLLHKDAQRDLLDAFSGSRELAKAVKLAYQSWQQLHHQRTEWEQCIADAQQEREQLEWKYHELSSLNFSEEAWQTLQADHNRLSHTAGLLEAAEMGLEQLSESEIAASVQINSVNKQLQHFLDYDDRLKTIIELLESAQVQLQEGIYELKHYRQHLDLDPQYLQEIEDRLAAIHAVARKYRVTPNDLPDLLETVTQRLEELNGNSDDHSMIKNENVAKEKYLEFTKRLSMARKKAGKLLAQQVSASMQTIAMVGGTFSVAFMPQEPGNANGSEQVEFQVATHKGLPLKPLAKVASGGELSRISLAIQVITSQVGTVPTLIFDEVDVGIGGRVAEIVGNLLKKLGKKRQVMCITHLPQVASTGNQQWQVSKTVDPADSKKVLSRITVLEQQARIEEITRMLGGIKITEKTREHAAEMLQRGASDS
tara:strand:+ start:1073 stop:2752 length:1680 start_codon:yes stop_codon:yes gene_type:complete